MNNAKYPLKEQEQIFLNFILKNPNINAILEGGFVDEISNWYLVAGCLNQTIWNQLTQREILEGIGDYDLVYFDNDLSYEKEDQIIKKVQKKYSKLNLKIDVKNQARVHLWIKEKWGINMQPLVSVEDAVASWPVTVACIGVRKEKEEYQIMAPYGLTDNLEMVLRPNKTTVMRESDFNYKTQKWMKSWPELKLIKW